MKVTYRGVEAENGVVRVVVASGGYVTRIPLPFGFKGTRQDIEGIVREQLAAINVVADSVRAVLPLEGSEWDIPDAKPARSHKKKPVAKGGSDGDKG